MVEPEVAYAHLDDAMALGEEMVAFIVPRVLEKRRPELQILERNIEKLEKITTPFPRMTYDEAVKILQSKGSEIQWGGDFGAADETYAFRGIGRCGSPLSGRREGLLYGARPGGPDGRCASTCWRRKAMARSLAAAAHRTMNC